ncbi:MAG: putative lipid II flippase FtsW [Patescibacteria group bacterium]
MSAILKTCLPAGRKIDAVLLGTTGVLLIFGILMLANISASFSQEKFGTTYYLLNHQLMNILIGLALGFLAFKINLDFLKKCLPFLLFGNLVLMLMVFLPVIGISAGGATRWLDLGFISLQPSEFLKLTFILYLASWLDTRTSYKNKLAKGERDKNFGQTFLAFLMVLGIIGIFLFLQPDISTFVIILLVAMILYFVAQPPFWHIAILFLTGAGVLALLGSTASYRMKRILVFLKPETDPMGIGYQIKQALIAVGSGGIFGLGLGMSRQKFGFLPASMTDSMFAVLAEETGFVGCFILIALFLTFLWRGFRIGKNSRDNFLKFTAFGIASWILVQTLINISSMIGLLPLAGIPLPFFSYGGSAMITELIGVGILLNISRR